MKMSKVVAVLLVLACSVCVFAKDDLVVFRDTTGGVPSVGQWYVSYTGPNTDPNSGLNGILHTGVALGRYLDTPLVGDIDGDGVDDVVVVSEEKGGDPNDDASYWTACLTKRAINGDGQVGWGGAATLSIARFFRSQTWYYDPCDPDYDDPNRPAYSLLADVNGDGKADAIRVEVGLAYNLRWRTYNSSEAGLGQAGVDPNVLSFGSTTLDDIPLTGNFNGDAYDDIALFRNGNWFTKMSDANGIDPNANKYLSGACGAYGDIPLVGDLNGDGRDDAVVVRWSSGGQLQWYGSYADTNGRIDWDTNGGVDLGLWGWWGGSDIPVLADVDEDGKDDIGVFRIATGEWFFKLTVGGATVSTTFGGSGDIPLVGEFNGIPGKPADLDDSGIVGMSDFALFAEYWLENVGQ